MNGSPEQNDKQTSVNTKHAATPPGHRRRKSKVTVPGRKSRSPSTQSTIEKLLKRKSGANLAQLMTATGWQSHSLRAALSRLRKAGVAVISAQNKKRVRIYRIGPE